MNYYNVLGLKNTASQDEIKAAYKKLIKKYHPDIYTGDKTFAEKKTAEINVAYDVLSNPVSKQEYDESIAPKYSYTPPKYDYSNSYKNYNTRNTYSYNNYSSKSYSTSRNTYNNYSYRNNTYSNRANNNYSNKTYSDGSEHDYSTYANYERKYADYHRSTTPNSDYTYYTDNFTDKVTNHINRMSSNNQLKIWAVILIVYFAVVIISTIQLVDTFSKDSTNKTTSSPKTSSSYSSTQKNNSASSLKTIDSIYKNSLVKNFYTKDEVLKLYNNYLRQSQSDMNFEDFIKLLEIYICSGN